MHYIMDLSQCLQFYSFNRRDCDWI